MKLYHLLASLLFSGMAEASTRGGNAAGIFQSIFILGLLSTAVICIKRYKGNKSKVSVAVYAACGVTGSYAVAWVITFIVFVQGF